MPFALVVIGLILIVSAAKNTVSPLGQQLVSDFTGTNNFTWWLAAVGGIGAVGYYSPLKTFSRYFMALIIISMIISNEGFFQQFIAALKAGPQSPTQTTTPSVGGTTAAASNPLPGTSTDGSSSMDGAPLVVPVGASPPSQSSLASSFEQQFGLSY